MLERASKVGGNLVRGAWWVVRPDPARPFVLGDSPVAATISFGHDDEWRAILAPEAYAVVMPLSPGFALVFAPKQLIPFSQMDESGVPQAINRLIWRAADRFVLGRDQHELESSVDDAAKQLSVMPPHDAAEIEERGRLIAEGIAADVVVRFGILKPLDDAWRRWESGRPVFGYVVFAAADRDMFVGPLSPPCIVPRGRLV